MSNTGSRLAEVSQRPRRGFREKSPDTISIDEAVSILGEGSVIKPERGILLAGDSFQKAARRGSYLVFLNGSGRVVTRKELTAVKDTHFLVYVPTQSLACLESRSRVVAADEVLPSACYHRKGQNGYYVLVPKILMGIGDCQDVPCIENRLPPGERFLRVREAVYCLALLPPIVDQTAWCCDNGWIAVREPSGKVRLYRWSEKPAGTEMKIASARI